MTEPAAQSTTPDTGVGQQLKRAGIAAGITWILAIALRLLFPPPSGWWEVASDTLFFLGFMPVVYVTRHRAGTFACVFWVASLLLAFAIQPPNRYIWVPDAALLVGFLPLLLKWRPGWPWLLFGIPTFFIGLILLLTTFLADEHFIPAGANVIAVKHHLADFHPAWTWIFIGLLCSICGWVLTIRDIIRFTRKWSKKKAA